MDARDRGRVMYRLADLIEEEIDELAALESLDNGKPVKDARAADLPLVIDCLRYYAGFADKIQGQRYRFAATISRTLGANRRRGGADHSLELSELMVAWKWGPALAAGCTIVMKRPSKHR